MKAIIRSLEKIGLQEFVNRFDKVEKVQRRKHHWLHLIKAGNLICPASGKSVSYCSYDEVTTKKGLVTYHYNFYDSDDVLFTIDHKMPISKGGSIISNDNIQPMICYENYAKSNQLIYL